MKPITNPSPGITWGWPVLSNWWSTSRPSCPVSSWAKTRTRWSIKWYWILIQLVRREIIGSLTIKTNWFQRIVSVWLVTMICGAIQKLSTEKCSLISSFKCSSNSSTLKTFLTMMKRSSITWISWESSWNPI